VDLEIAVFACLSGGYEHRKYPKGAHILTERVFFVLRRPPQTKTSIILFYSPVHAVPEPFVHVYSQVVRASHVEVDKEALVDIVGNEFEQVHHLPCQAEPTVLGSNGDRGYVPVVLEIIALGFSEN